MQVPVVLLGCVLTFGAGALSFSDYSSYPPATAPAVRLASLYLSDDNAASGAVRLGLDKIGYATAATTVFDPALRRDPANGTRWVDAGEAFFATGDRERAEYCYQQAASVAPGDPITLLAVGDFYFNLKDSRRALPYFARILTLTGRKEEAIMVQNVFGYFEQMHVRDLNLLGLAIPDARNARLYLAYLMSRPDTAANPALVRNVWRWLHGKQYDDDPSTVEYARYLWAKKEYAAASEDWGIHSAGRNDGYPAKTSIFDGGFEFELGGSPFDWQFGSAKGIDATRDPAVHHDGNYSIRLDFTGNDNPEVRNLRQQVFVTPGRYRLDGFLRTAAITGAEGIRLSVQSLQTAAMLAETPPLTGTNDWTAATATFDVPPGTFLIEVQLARHKAIRIDNQLTGKVWLDSVSLTHLH